MKIDGNELAILQNDLDRRGQKQEVAMFIRRQKVLKSSVVNLSLWI